MLTPLVRANSPAPAGVEVHHEPGRHRDAEPLAGVLDVAAVASSS
jgi:hypothetical protein